MGCFEENEVVTPTQARSPVEDKNITCVGKLYLVDLRQILSKCEPGALSAANFKNLLRDCKTNSKANGRVIALQILEFITGVAPGESIERSDRDLDVTAKWFSDLSIARGRLARDLVSPINWNHRQGHYWLEDLGKEIVLHFANGCNSLAEGARPLIFGLVAASDRGIRRNFSAERASIMTLRSHTMHNINMSCLALFAPIEGSLRTKTPRCAPSACKKDACAWEVPHLALEDYLPAPGTPQTYERSPSLEVVPKEVTEAGTAQDEAAGGFAHSPKVNDTRSTSSRSRRAVAW